MRNLIRLLLIGLIAGCALAKPPEMKTHSSAAKGAKVTVIHFSAPW